MIPFPVDLSTPQAAIPRLTPVQNLAVAVLQQIMDDRGTTELHTHPTTPHAILQWSEIAQMPNLAPHICKMLPPK